MATLHTTRQYFLCEIHSEHSFYVQWDGQSFLKLLMGSTVHIQRENDLAKSLRQQRFSVSLYI